MFRTRNRLAPACGPGHAIVRFVLEFVVDCGSPEHVCSIARQLEERDWDRTWARATADQRVQLVDCFRKNLADAFEPATEAEAEAIWRFLLRSQNVDGAMASLAKTTAGVRCARRHVEQGDGGALAPAVREAFADELGLDAVTLEAAEGDEGGVLLATLRRSPRDAELTARERAWLARLRQLLGASAPLR